ncbi:MAG: SDR family oxidoreductase [Cyanobacteria bacterium J06621_11]
MTSPVVLVTGCSSGIGNALCWAFQREGYRVVATARRLETIQDLKVAGMSVFRLDVTDEKRVSQVVQSVVAAEGRIDVLVNNAGFGQFGPLMDVVPEQMQAQFQTNVFAPMVVARQVALVMKIQKSGLIVNMGSISGVVTTPFAGAYCASKSALHSLSAALRMELVPFGIRVVTVQPGAIASQFGQSAENSLANICFDSSWYGDWAQTIRARATLSQLKATPVDNFATQLVSRLSQPKPPSIIRLGKKSFWLPLLEKVLPSGLLERLLRRRFDL